MSAEQVALLSLATFFVGYIVFFTLLLIWWPAPATVGYIMLGAIGVLFAAGAVAIVAGRGRRSVR